MKHFGAELKESDFLLQGDRVHINHGSYGAVPKVVLEERLRLINELENDPDIWFRLTARRKWTENIQAAADFVGSDPDNLVFVNNATTGCNAILKSIDFRKDDAILVHNYTYNAVKNACLSSLSRVGGDMVTVKLPLELPDKTTIIDLYREKLEKHSNIKLVVLELISSCSAVQFPVKELIALCKEFGALVLIDGAHGPGHVDLNLETLGADFFTGNFHKWVFTPRGCAVLWVAKQHHELIKPAMTGHGYKMGSIQHEFFNQGTSDTTPYFCASKGIDYHKSLGGTEQIHKYCCELLDQAVNMLVDAWKTEKFPVGTDLLAPHMRLVRLPFLGEYMKSENAKNGKESVFGDMSALMMELSSKFGITSVCLGIQEKYWVRLSVHVYNSLSDYEKLRDAILKLQSEV